jgi:hypothetical protein
VYLTGQGQLRWIGHVELKDADDLLSTCRKLEVSKGKGKGSNRKMWKEFVSDDLKKLHLKKEDVQDSGCWRNIIVINAYLVEAWRQES